MSGLPSGWCETELGALIEHIQAGLNLKCEERPPRDGEKGLVKISAVTWGRFDEDQSKTLPSDATAAETARIVPGDLLISRANTIELVGATVIVEDVTRALYLSDKVLRLVVPEESKRWINYALKTAEARKAIQDASSGNQLSMRNISQENLRRVTIPLAPLPEQKRIADKLDSVLARVDACRNRLDRIPALLKRFRQSVLAAATDGRLTQDWRRSEGLSEVAAYPRVRLSFVATSRLGKMLDKAKNSGDLVPYLRNVNVRWYSFDLGDVQLMRVEPWEMSDLFVREGDVLVCEGGEPGRCAIWRSGDHRFVFQKALHRVRPDTTRLHPEWLVHSLKFAAENKVLDVLFTGTTIKHLTGVALANFTIPLPSIQEQS
ncbi:MAG TPA: hypothetical protein DCL01_02020, partial [Thauera sp.]|nr:hypothetical protein [Thauera sp.]